MYRILLFIVIFSYLYSQKVSTNCQNIGIGGELSGHSFFDSNYSLSHSAGAKVFLYNFSCNRHFGLWATTGFRNIIRKNDIKISNNYWDLMLALQYRKRPLCLPTQISPFIGINLAILLGNKSDSVSVEARTFVVAPVIGAVFKIRRRWFIVPSVDYALINPIKPYYINGEKITTKEFKLNLLVGYRLWRF